MSQPAEAGAFPIAGVPALFAASDVQQATPPPRTEPIASVWTDVTTVKEGVSR